jgi:hypothetical protein
VTDKLKHLSEWGILEDNSWSINIPLKSREEGNLQSGCFISFKREISSRQIAMIRILLTDTYWPEQEDGSERSVFKCFWARDRKERTPKFPKPPSNPKSVKAESKSVKVNPKVEPKDPKVEPKDPKVEPKDPKVEPKDPEVEPKDPEGKGTPLVNTKVEPKGKKPEPKGSKGGPKYKKVNAKDRNVESKTEKPELDEKKEYIKNTVRKAKPVKATEKKVLAVPLTSQPVLNS